MLKTQHMLSDEVQQKLAPMVDEFGLAFVVHALGALCQRRATVAKSGADAHYWGSGGAGLSRLWARLVGRG